jgi:hypothetical protein
LCIAFVWRICGRYGEWASGVGVGDGKAQCINICMRVGVCCEICWKNGCGFVGLVFASFLQVFREICEMMRWTVRIECFDTHHSSSIKQQLYCDFEGDTGFYDSASQEGALLTHRPVGVTCLLFMHHHVYSLRRSRPKVLQPAGVGAAASNAT